MSDLTLVPSDADVTVTITAPIVHRCPFVHEVDHGRISITWRVDGRTFELHALRRYLDAFRTSKMSHEAITDLIRHELGAAEGVELISVDTTWDTAGMEVRCSTLPTPVAPQ